jgi:hypothetical protein
MYGQSLSRRAAQGIKSEAQAIAFMMSAATSTALKALSKKGIEVR